MGEVVELKNAAVPLSDPDPEVIAVLEWYLQAAKSGEVIGVGIAAEFRDGTTGSVCKGLLTYGLIGRLFGIQEFARRLLTEDIGHA